MAVLDVTRAELALLALYLSKAETRDKICRAIQYGSKAISGGQPGIAQGIEKNTSQARKVFRLAKVSTCAHADALSNSVGYIRLCICCCNNVVTVAILYAIGSCLGSMLAALFFCFPLVTRTS